MRTAATSEKAIKTLEMLSKVQSNFVEKLSQLCTQQMLPEQFTTVQWLRDNGTHGGGLRFEAPQQSIFNQASVNVSQIQYEDSPSKRFVSATALSTIIHPINPLIPSIHIHISWTQLDSGKSYWRLMADLNPAIPCDADTEKFNATLKANSGEYYQQATQQGDQYFYIPALQTHRGVSHFYLEAFNPKGTDGSEFARQFVEAVIDRYIAILTNKLCDSVETTEAQNRVQNRMQNKVQLDYHTLYFYQVLTLDKGTTAGLLVHDQNDVGTLGSLPRFVNRNLLALWVTKTPAPGDKLLKALIGVLPTNERAEVTTKVKVNIARVIREHYQMYPL